MRRWSQKTRRKRMRRLRLVELIRARKCVSGVCNDGGRMLQTRPIPHISTLQSGAFQVDYSTLFTPPEHGCITFLTIICSFISVCWNKKALRTLRNIPKRLQIHWTSFIIPARTWSLASRLSPSYYSFLFHPITFLNLKY